MFKVSALQVEYFPDRQVVEHVLSTLGLPEERLRGVLQAYVCSEPKDAAEGYQKKLAHNLEEYLKKTLSVGDLESRLDRSYTNRLGEQSDLVLCRHGAQRAIFFEIEFRPNVEKDLVKFQIGYNSSRLGAAVLILALAREVINPGYTTMPEFSKFLKVIKELRPDYPLLLYGIGSDESVVAGTQIKRRQRADPNEAEEV